MFSKLTNARGFTLIELVIIIVPQVSGYHVRGQRSSWPSGAGIAPFRDYNLVC